MINNDSDFMNIYVCDIINYFMFNNNFVMSSENFRYLSTK